MARKRSETLDIDTTPLTIDMSHEEAARYFRGFRLAEHVVSRLERQANDIEGEPNVSAN